MFALCVVCIKNDLGHFVCDKFNAWSRKKKKFAAHNTTQYHQLALTRADALKSSFVHPDSSIGNRMQRITESNIAQNRYIIRCMADAILFVASNVLLYEAIEMTALLIPRLTRVISWHFLTTV